jgi:hypothetical protein
MAIGDPWAFDKTVTVGVVSAKGRRNLTLDPNSNSFENFIQTDAAINFGNSGGPLIDVDGQVIGINTAIYRPAQNIGFAVPINTAKAILEQLKTKGKSPRLPRRQHPETTKTTCAHSAFGASACLSSPSKRVRPRRRGLPGHRRLVDHAQAKTTQDHRIRRKPRERKSG